MADTSIGGDGFRNGLAILAKMMARRFAAEEAEVPQDGEPEDDWSTYSSSSVPSETRHADDTSISGEHVSSSKKENG